MKSKHMAPKRKSNSLNAKKQTKITYIDTRNLPIRDIKNMNINPYIKSKHLQNKKNTRNLRKKRKINKKKVRLLIIILLIILISIIHNVKKDKRIKPVSAIGNIEIENENINNSNLELEANSSILEIDSKTTDWNLILVNRYNPLPDDYEFELTSIENSHKADSRVAESITKMLDDARSEGLKPLLCASYRSIDTQTKLYNNKVKEYKKEGLSDKEAKEKASFWVAIPGTSEHHTGLAFDIVSMNYQVLDEKQEETDVQKWLMENCSNYGFILRYPTNKKEITKINYEPWHYRYVGIENAKFIEKKGFCLEEYIEYLKKFE